MGGLKPRTIRLETAMKFFGLESGSSIGTSVGMDFDVEGELDHEQLKVAVLEKKEQLDLLALVTLLMNGGLTRLQYDNQRALVKNNYDALLKRKAHVKAE